MRQLAAVVMAVAMATPVGAGCLAGSTGDVLSDARLDAGDLAAMVLELADGDGSDPGAAVGGSFPGHDGADLDDDGEIDRRDLSGLATILLGSGSHREQAAIDDFLYQLQDLDLQAVGATAYDLVVMDYSADGSAAGEYSAAEIEALRSSSGGDKLVLAYLSIGEAENYRYYWQPGWTPGSPTWLGPENPSWPGNYKVRYWQPGWQTVIIGYLDRLLAAGFDGAYLDIIDAYEYWADQGHTTAAEEMADLVELLGRHARVSDPDFLLMPQNAPELAALVPRYLAAVDGLAQEDIHFGYDADDVATPVDATEYLRHFLDLWVNAGKLVLTVDYATTPANVDVAYQAAESRCYVPFATVRDLDQLTINPGNEPD